MIKAESNRNLLAGASVFARVLLLLAIGLNVQALSGCVESQFRLAPESRLPNWFAVPDGLRRQDVNVTLTYYSAPWGRRATLSITDAHGKILRSVKTSVEGTEPKVISSIPGGSYPMYEILKGDGITDVVEHRFGGPVFYMTDDSEVRRRLGVL
jgi:hypothetical protein